MKIRCITLPATDLLIVGGGAASLWAVLTAQEYAPKRKVRILTKGRVGHSGSSLVSVSVHRFAPDDAQLYTQYCEALRVSAAGVGDASLMELLFRQGRREVAALMEYGLPLEYRYKQGGTGASVPYLACCDPKLGRIYTSPLAQLLRDRPNVEILERCTAAALVVVEGRVLGVLAVTGEDFLFCPARSTILATGGAGRIFSDTSNTSDLTADGHGLALRAGLALRDMEFFQFYPYRIHSPRRANIFPEIFEHGAVLLNGKGERFMASYPRREQENRDVLCREMFRQELVRLSLKDCPPDYLRRECPDIWEMHPAFPHCPLLLKPVAHFSIGGVPLREDCSTELEGLFVCGELAGGLHGANRLSGSALTEALVFGRIAGQSALRHCEQTDGRQAPDSLLDAQIAGLIPTNASRPDVPSIFAVDEIKSLRDRMGTSVSIIREETALNGVLKDLNRLEASFDARPPGRLRHWIEGKNLFAAARAVTQSAQFRRESRGAHFRSDCPATLSGWRGNIYYSLTETRFGPTFDKRP